MKKFLWSAFLLVLIILIYTFIDTYGLLESNGKADVKQSIGKWNITLNGVDITTTKEITANDLIYEGSTNVEPGYFAPGTNASYNIIIDPKDTDVSVRYDIIADLSQLENHPNISFDITGEVVKKIDNGIIIYSGIIPLSSIKQGKKANLKVSLIWNNDENNNELDNTLNGSDIPLSIKITARFTQYTGEKL